MSLDYIFVFIFIRLIWILGNLILLILKDMINHVKLPNHFLKSEKQIQNSPIQIENIQRLD